MGKNDLTDVQAILKRFGAFIYTGNRLDDIVLMDLELQDLYESNLITIEEYKEAKSILKREYNEEILPESKE
ncbi:YqgQ family protein [Tepidibacillus sp. HK-1]|uniref:YqgQ family protein n=1 Tax=Tepidibacillus sp. HK-1 TaxID=1883407 RepID=UPI000853C928|nr:YqgQ family protein [Tepidibacillus sp. HK-1]GBF11268.1 hypothetical protein HK1_01292 [Tepidibacillus sp. HK-1]